MSGSIVSWLDNWSLVHTYYTELILNSAILSVKVPNLKQIPG